VFESTGNGSISGAHQKQARRNAVVKSKTLAVTNVRLRRERELAGWSQQYVAEQIGAPSSYYISRWERGAATPRPYYRAKLCALFGKDAEALGLVASPPSAEAPTVAAPTPQPLATALFPTSLGLVGREGLLRQLRDALSAPLAPADAVLYGLPGVGKTSLALALARDPLLQAHFRDGILWAGVGPHANLAGLLATWGAQLGMAAADTRRLTGPGDWTRQLRTAIGPRKMLLVIDDVWTLEEALAFRVGGPNCGYVVTTRFPELALRLGNDQVLAVQELDLRESLELLERFVPGLLAREPQVLREVARAVGGLPLALTLIGRYLRVQAHSGQPRRIRAALERLRNAEDRLRLAEPSASLERPASVRAGGCISLEAVIETSDQWLGEEERQAFYALSVLPAKPDGFSEEAALAVAATGTAVLDTLTDAGLLEGQSAGRYTVHQTLADYARTKLRGHLGLVRKRLVAFVAGYVEHHASDDALLEQEFSTLLAGLEAASLEHCSRELVESVQHVTPFLLRRGLYPLATELLERSQEVARALGDREALRRCLTILGESRGNQGDYGQAEALFREALDLARQGEDRGHTCILLSNLGGIAFERGEYALAQQYAAESLEVAERIGDANRIALLTSNLVTLADAQGDYAGAERYARHGLAVARAHDLQELLPSLLLNIGLVAREQGEYAQAASYLEEGLTVARRAGLQPMVSKLLSATGGLLLEQGGYDGARRLLQEALELARPMKASVTIGATLCRLGILEGRVGAYAQARVLLEEGLALSRQIGNRSLVSQCLGAQGEVALEEGDEERAEALLQEGLQLSRLIQFPGGISGTLLALGALALSRERYRQAEAYVREGLDLARRIGKRRDLCLGFYWWGMCQLRQQQAERAAAAFRDMHSRLPPACPELRAYAAYGLARVAAARGDLAEARQQAKASQDTFGELGHARAREVTRWLRTGLPR
jgi:tetratricopeptide (TPR) repeat protein/transcriptional regulator with XRE-family HTH domain